MSVLPIDQLVGLAGLQCGARYEFFDDLKSRRVSYPILPLCRACASDCKVNSAPGLLVFVCHAFHRPKK